MKRLKALDERFDISKCAVFAGVGVLLSIVVSGFQTIPVMITAFIITFIFVMGINEFQKRA